MEERSWNQKLWKWQRPLYLSTSVLANFFSYSIYLEIFESAEHVEYFASKVTLNFLSNRNLSLSLIARIQLVSLFHFSFHQCFLLSSILYLFIYFFPLHILFIFKQEWIIFLNGFLLFQRILNKVLYIYCRFLVSMSVDYYFVKLQVTYKIIEDKLWVFHVWKSWSSSKSVEFTK